MDALIDVEVIEDPAAATVALDPIRGRLLAELAQPASAAALAARLGIPRQKVNYHLRALEAHRLVRVADTRQWGGLTERMLVATASSYLVSPAALGAIAPDLTPDLAPDPARAHARIDRLSAAYLIALAARIVREVSDLARRAREVNKRLPTMSIDTEIRFKSAAERAAFTQELTTAINSLVARYHDAEAPGGRPHRLVVVSHPLLQEPSA